MHHFFKVNKQLSAVAVLLALPFLALPLTVQAAPVNQKTVSLDFAKAPYQLKTAQVAGKTISYRAYEGITYVKHPVDTVYQKMNIYIPEEYYEVKPVGSYTEATAPIFLPNTVGGYMPGEPGTPGKDRFTGKDNAALVALSKGYVVAEPGARGRTNQDAAGNYTGKAPAAIVDLKAAVRYLRYNDKKMPGDAEKIISNGTSAGGALSALLGATGNSPDYAPYLKALGAAGVRDDIFAASVYCPITNLEHADMAYEWYFGGIYDYTRRGLPGMMPSPGGHQTLAQGEAGAPVPGVNQAGALSGQPKLDPGTGPGAALPGLPPAGMKLPVTTGTMTPEQIKLAKILQGDFPAYLNSLKLTWQGKSLKLDLDGEGSFKDYLQSFVVASAQKALNEGEDLKNLTWLTLKDGRVTGLDFPAYVRYVKRMKTTPAFDGVDLSNGENDEFGTSKIKAQHFTQFSYQHSTVGGSLAEAQIVKMMNPMNYIGTDAAKTAKYWRIRHGAIDSDTALDIPLILATKLGNKGYQVNFAVPWNQGHGGDYDLEELFKWMEQAAQSKK